MILYLDLIDTITTTVLMALWGLLYEAPWLQQWP